MEKHKGFTLIELLVVISIIGMLASVIMVSVNNARSKGRYSRVLGDLRQLVSAAELYYNNHDNYPGDVGTGADPGFIGDGLIARWPTPPCNNWTYDWENWAGNRTYRISVRNASVGSVFYMCISSNDPNCDGGGTPIQNVASKSITCNE